MAASSETFEYGFRADPMEFVQNDETLQGALVRKHVFGAPNPGDEAMLQEKIDEILAEQNEDGTFGEDGKDTDGKVERLLELGCSPDRPEAQKALAAIRRALERDDRRERADDDQPLVAKTPLPVLTLLGMADRPEVKAAIRTQADEIGGLLGGGCPHTPYIQITKLWSGRHLVDVDAAIAQGLTWVRESLEPPGCSREMRLTIAWAVVHMVAEIDHPIATEIARGLVPMLLRSQNADGGWTDPHGEPETLPVMRALVKHGLLEELRKLPPLPPDWEIANSIPTPCQKPRNIVCENGRLWVLDSAQWSAIAVSPTDGAVQKTVKLPKKDGMSGFGFAAGDGVFYLTAHGAEGSNQTFIYEVDINTGTIVRELVLRGSKNGTGIARVGRKLVVADGWEGGVWILDLDAPDAQPEHTWVAPSMPDYLTSDGNDMWGVDWFSPSLVRTNIEGELLDWGARPFGFNPVAWDGEHLWALDPDSKRICLLEKTETGREITAALAARRAARE